MEEVLAMKWIKTTEKLPSESDGYVLVCMPNEFPFNQGERVTLAQYSEYANRWFGYSGTVGGKAPIAWMPLPEPVNDEKKQELDDQPAGCMYCQHFDGMGCMITGIKFWSGMNVACRPKGCPLDKL